MGEMGPNRHVARSGMVVYRTTLTLQTVRDQLAFQVLVEHLGSRPHKLARTLVHNALEELIASDAEFEAKFQKVWKEKTAEMHKNEIAFRASRDAERRREGFVVIDGGLE